MLKQEQLANMLRLQNDINAKVDPHWLNTKQPFMRAAMVEGVEAMKYLPWKWWKDTNKEINWSQLKLELVDIWHFALSWAIIIENDRNFTSASETLFPARSFQRTSGEQYIEFNYTKYFLADILLLDRIQLMIGMAAFNHFDTYVFESIMTDCKMSWDELYCQYIGKNVLNFFRQDHGYKAGTYTKIWDGKEDNEHLSEILTVGTDIANLQSFVYNQLSARYDAYVLKTRNF